MVIFSQELKQKKRKSSWKNYQSFVSVSGRSFEENQSA